MALCAFPMPKGGICQHERVESSDLPICALHMLTVKQEAEELGVDMLVSMVRAGM